MAKSEIAKQLEKERKEEQQSDRKARQRELHTPSPEKPKRGTFLQEQTKAQQ
jgi:hypothetical protein